jgi:uncharacterized protein
LEPALLYEEAILRGGSDSASLKKTCQKTLAKKHLAGGFSRMRSIAFADFLIGVGILFVLEGLLFAASPAWMRRAMKSALATPDNILRAVGLGSAVAGLILIWFVRR